MSKKGQVTFEFATLAVAVCAALLVMLNCGYIRKVVSGKIKEGSDRVGGSFYFDPVNNPTIKTQRTVTEESVESLSYDAKGNCALLFSNSGNWSSERSLSP